MNCPLCGADLWKIDDIILCFSPECKYQEDEDGNVIFPRARLSDSGIIDNPDYDPLWVPPGES
jgi:hypothetical protein